MGIELSKVFQDKPIFPPEDLLINNTPEELSCDISTYYSHKKRAERCTYLHLMISQVFSLNTPVLELKDEAKVQHRSTGLPRKPKGDLFDEVRVYRSYK